MLLILAVLVLVVVGVSVFAAASRSVQTTNVGRRARRIGLVVFFASVAVNAGLGIYAVLTPHFGDTGGKLLGTSLCVTGAILMALCCEPAWERRLLTPVPIVGALLGSAAFAGLIVGLWTEPESGTLRKLLASAFAAAIGCTLSSVVVLERERKGISLRHRRAIIATLGVIAFDVAVAVAVIWIPAEGPGTVSSNLMLTGVVATAACVLAAVLTLFRPGPPTLRLLDLTLGLIGLAATVAVALIWADVSGDTGGKFAGTCLVAAAACLLAAILTHARLAPEHRWVLTTTFALLVLGAVLVAADIWLQVWGLTRALGVVLIALAAFAVTLPVLHRLDRGVVTATAAAGTAIRHCPHCGGKLTGEVGVAAECARCGRAFTVIDSEPRGPELAGASRRPGEGRLAGTSRRSRERRNVAKDSRSRT